MKKGTKIGLGGMTLLLGSVLLTGCTASFCSNKDKAHMLYLYDYGVTTYYDTQVEGSELLTIDGITFSNNIYYKASYDDAYGINAADKTALKTSSSKAVAVAVPTLNYWAAMDRLLLIDAINTAKVEIEGFDASTLTASKIARGWDEGFEDLDKGILDTYGYLKFYDTADNGKNLWANWAAYDAKVRASGDVSIDECPTTDYVKIYKTTMNTYINTYRSCLATSTGDYGKYGPHKSSTEISAKSWASAFSKTNFLWLEGILVWPMGAFIDVLAGGMLKAGVGTGIAQLLAILVITFIVRSIMLLVTWKQSSSNAKMTELQPQIAKIQAKYPNANTNQYEKQRQAAEMADLYKKNKINPLSSLLVMVVQFPVFICVWAALQGSSILSSGSLLGLDFSASISSILFNTREWNIAAGGGALTALILFLLMAAGQVVSMLLPQWLQKRKAKNVAKLGKNPAKQQQDNKMKWFTYIMCAMIIFMGFSLASGMGVYWFIGALFSIGQTLVTNYINAKKANRR